MRPPDVRPWGNKGVMGNIVKTTLNMEAMRSMDPSDYLSPLDVILDEKAFLSHILEGAKLPTVRKVSRCMSHHEVVLTDFGIFRRRLPGEERCHYSMALFTVLKKSGELRLIQDDRLLNKIYERPPEMYLPKIHDLIEEILKNEFIGQADAVSMFYQFALHKDLQKYFAVLLGGGRGETVEGRMTRMPMGFSWAPAIGQRCANVLIRDLGRAWVDNFMVLGTDETDFAIKRSKFLERCRQVNMQLDDEELKPVRETTALGIEFDLRRKRYRMDSDWCVKTALKIRALLDGDLTIHGLYEISGSLIWRNHVMERKLCNMPHILNALSVEGSAISHNTKAWSSVITVTLELREEILKEVLVLEGNAYGYLKAQTESEVDIWTDASLTHAAYLIFRNQVLIASGQIELPPQHIFYSELHIAIEAVKKAQSMGFKSGTMFIDNAPTAICMERRASSNFTANRALAKLPDFDTKVQWVPSAVEMADTFTRPPFGLPHLPPVRVPPNGTHASILTALIPGASPQVRAMGHHTF